jgi:hypothetical protein
MSRAAALLLAIGLTFAVWGAVSCYKGTPPCRPESVDWPRCRPWDPPLLPRDSGVDQ